MNLRSEWYKPDPSTNLPDLFRVFTYWEDDSAPGLEDLRRWAEQA